MRSRGRSRWAESMVKGLSGLPRWPLAAGALLVVSGVAWLVAPKSMGEPLSYIAIFVGAIVAGVTFIRRSGMLTGRERQAWSLVGWGFTIGSFGMVALGVTDAVSGGAPAFGAADVVFILGYLGVLIGFASLPHTSGTRLLRLRTGMDGLIGAVAIGALLWALVLGTVGTNFEGVPAWQRLIGSAYPMVDLAALVVFMIVTVRHSSRRFDLRIILLATGILAQAIADVQFFATGVGRSFADAQPAQLLYMFAIGCYVATSAIVDRVPPVREYANRRTPLWALIAPYGAAAVMVVVLVAHLWDAELGRVDQLLIAATFIVAVLVIGRQGIAIRENRMIVERQRTDLVSSISHELRTPLTAMVGFLAILQEDPKLHLEERIEMIEVVTEQAAYLERIVEDLLLMAHGDPGRMHLDVSEQPISEIIDHAVHVTSIDRRSVTVEAAPDLTAIVDAGRIQQVLVNLLSNASRYGGHSCLVVAFTRGSELLIEVHDDGSGVPRKYELTIWERFERGPNRYNAAVPGSGIGLSMVRSIAEAHGGRATYRTSERLGGACFSIELPGRTGKPDAGTVAPPVTGTLAVG